MPWRDPAERRSTIQVLASSVLDDELDFGGHSSPDGAVTLLLTDVEGAAALLQRLGDKRSNDLLRDHNSIVRQLARAYSGEIVRSEQDGYLITYASAHSALWCALELRDAFAGLPLPQTGEPLGVRIGLHTGHIIADAGSLFGRNVVLAARIADRARAGEILVSSLLKEYTEDDPRFAFEHAGDVHFKGVAREHRIYSVRWRGAGPRG